MFLVMLSAKPYHAIKPASRVAGGILDLQHALLRYICPSQHTCIPRTTCRYCYCIKTKPCPSLMLTYMVSVRTCYDLLIPCLGMDTVLRLHRSTGLINGVCVRVYEFTGHLAIISQRASYL